MSRRWAFPITVSVLVLITGYVTFDWITRPETFQWWLALLVVTWASVSFQAYHFSYPKSPDAAQPSRKHSMKR